MLQSGDWLPVVESTPDPSVRGTSPRWRAGLRKVRKSNAMLPVTLGRPKVAVKVWFLPQAGNSAAFGKADTCNTKTQEPPHTLLNN